MFYSLRSLALLLACKEGPNKLYLLHRVDISFIFAAVVQPLLRPVLLQSIQMHDSLCFLFGLSTLENHTRQQSNKLGALHHDMLS